MSQITTDRKDKCKYLEENRKLHLELIRIIAVVLVVLNHSDLYYTFYKYTDNIITFICSLLVSSVCKMNVPLFMMITGAVLIDKAESWKEILRKRVSKMVIVLVVFSAIMYGLQCFAWNQNVFSLSEFIHKLFTNDVQISYWYLYKYIEILLLLPFVGTMARTLNKDTLEYLLALGLLFKVMLPIISTFIGYSVPMSFFILDDGVFYVVLGYYFENQVKDERIREISCTKILATLLGCIGIVVGMVLTEHKVMGDYSEYVLNIMTPVMVILMYILIRKVCILYRYKTHTTKIITALGSCTFGVYLIEHIGQKLFIGVYLWMCERVVGVAACMVYVVCILIFGFTITFLLKKNSIVRKYI